MNNMNPMMMNNMNPMMMMQMMMLNNQMSNLQTASKAMQNNNNNSNNFQNSDSQPQSNNNNNNGGITVIFRKNQDDSQNENGENIAVQCTADEKVSEVIKKYRSKANDHDETKKFIFNAKALNQSLTVGEAGLQEHSNIFVVTTKGVKGA
jgi:hypothetical protein